MKHFRDGIFSSSIERREMKLTFFGKKWREARKRVNRVAGREGKLKTIIKAFPRQETKEKVKIN
jgi:hypothetical protein